MSQIFMSTFGGRTVFLLQPRLEDIDINDIAHHLSMLCRWVGSVREFYSVAQHSVHVAELCPLEARPWALLHDAFEAYGGDVNARLKGAELMKGYRVIESLHLAKIFQRFGLPGVMPAAVQSAVDQADLLMRAVEAQDLRPHPLPEYQQVARPALFAGKTIEPWSPAEAKRRYLEAFWSVMRGARPHARLCVVCGGPAEIRCSRQQPYRLESEYLCRRDAPAWVRGAA